MATPQQHADALLAQWQTLWPLPAAERIQIIESTKLDLQYEETLETVHQAVQEAA